MHNEHPYVKIQKEVAEEHLNFLICLSAIFVPIFAWLLLAVPVGWIFPETDYGTHPVINMHLELTILVAGSFAIAMLTGHFLWDMIPDKNGREDPRPWRLLKLVMLPVLITAFVTLFMTWFKTKAVVPEFAAFIMQNYYWFYLAVVLPLVIRFFIKNWGTRPRII